MANGSNMILGTVNTASLTTSLNQTSTTTAPNVFVLRDGRRARPDEIR